MAEEKIFKEILPMLQTILTQLSSKLNWQNPTSQFIKSRNVKNQMRMCKNKNESQIQYRLNSQLKSQIQ